MPVGPCKQGVLAAGFGPASASTPLSRCRQWVLLGLMLLISLYLRGQSTAVCTGRVSTSAGQPLSGVSVSVQGTTQGTVTDSAGGFVLHRLTGGMLELSMVGFQPRVVAVDLDKLVEVVLEPDTRLLDDVEVTGTRTEVSFHRIDPRLAGRVVNASGGIEGIVKSQMGVSSSSELSSQYRVRGGNFDENMVVVNGTEIYRPFLIRSGEQEGLSFVNPDLVESLRFSSGGFDASYGDRMSSVLDVRYKTPDRYAGSAQLGFLGGSVHLEGASVQKRLTHVTGVRYKTNQYLFGTLDTQGDYAPSFFDAQTYLTYRIGARWKADFTGYYAQNRYQFVPQTRETTFGTINEMKKLKIYFDGQEDDRYQTGLVAGSVSYAPREKHEFQLSAGLFRAYEEERFDILGQYWLQELEGGGSNTTGSIGIGGHLQHARNELLGVVRTVLLRGEHRFLTHRVLWGVRYQQELFKDYQNEWEMRDSAGYSVPGAPGNLELAYSYQTELNTSSNRVSGHLLDEWKWENGWGRWGLTAGIRLSYWDFNREWLASPRLNLSWWPAYAPQWRFYSALGWYNQSPFYREIRTPQGELNPQIRSQHSFQVVAGADWYFTWGDRPFKFTGEAYYKHLTDLISYQIDNVRIRYSGQNDARGYAAGVDLKLNGEFVPGVESWATVSLMRTAEDLYHDFRWVTLPDGSVAQEEVGYIPRPSDQRLTFSLFFQDYLPNNPTFRIHLNLFYGTGLPFGPPRSERYLATGRMPDYRRVDLGLAKDLLNWRNDGRDFHGKVVRSAWLGLEVFNLFNFSNTISHYWVTDVNNRQFAVPNYLTSRRFQLKLTMEF